MTSSNVPDEDLARAMRIAGIPKKAKLSSNFDVTILSMVEHNLGVTIMPRLILEGSTADVAAIPLDPPLKRTAARRTSRPYRWTRRSSGRWAWPCAPSARPRPPCSGS